MMSATMRAFPFCLLAVAAFACGCSNSTSTSPSTGTSGTNDPYANYTQTYTVPYSNAPAFTNLTSTLKVQAQVNGGTVSSYTVDTGSVGVVVPASEVPNLPTNAPAGSLTYSSSGLKLTGVWATLPMTFPGAVRSDSGNAVATATVPVLAVTSGTCTGTGVNSGSCTGAIPHMLGVGFGRGTDVTTAPTYNPFLNLAEMGAGTMRRGYTISRAGITLGLTTTAVSGYTRQTLVSAGTPAAGTHNDWTTPSGSFAIGGTTYSGVVLLDTGLLNMIVEDAGIPQSGTVTGGTSMSVTLGTQSYSFKAGDSGAQTPTSVSYASASHGTFVNTGLRALGHFDLLFDADGGYFGLKPE